MRQYEMKFERPAIERKSIPKSDSWGRWRF